jgi:hypothetical protein
MYIDPESEITLSYSEDKEILVLADLGGGTFDLSIKYHKDGYLQSPLFFDSLHMGGEFILNQIKKYGDKFIPQNIRNEFDGKEVEDIIIEFFSVDKPIHETIYGINSYKGDEYKRYKKLLDLYFDIILEYLVIQLCGFIKKLTDEYRSENIVSKITIFLSGKGWLLVPKDISSYNTARDIKAYIEKRIREVINYIRRSFNVPIETNHIYINDYNIKNGKKKLVTDLIQYEISYDNESRRSKHHGVIGVGMTVYNNQQKYPIKKDDYFPIFLNGKGNLPKLKDFDDFLKNYSVNTDDIFSLNRLKDLFNETGKDEDLLKREINRLFSQQTGKLNPFTKEEDDYIIICGSPLVHLFEVYVKDQLDKHITNNIVTKF